VASSGIPFLPDHWYYNTESGELTNGNNLENLGNNLLGGLGWHELNIPGSATEAQAAAEAVKEFPAGKTPTTSLATGAANAVSNETGISATGVAAIGDFFSRLGKANTWLRVAEAVAGFLLLALGLNALLHNPAGKVIRTVR
jgi:hypothetical protein